MDPRATVPLTANVLRLLSNALNQSPTIQAAALGIYEALHLKGTYRMDITAAQLVPVDDSEPQMTANSNKAHSK